MTVAMPAGTGLHDREGKFSASQKTGFLAVDGDQVGLGQNLQQTFLLQSLDDRAQVNLRIKEKQVQEVR